MRHLRLLVVLLLACAGTGAASLAATRAQCRVPLPPASRQPNIFSPAQEAMLGEAIAGRFESYLRVIDDEALTAVLRRIGDRLTARLPDTGLTIRLQLVDIPEANAFALPGGHVYVSRKLVGLTRSEDELAGVIGHELGHLVARHTTIAITRQLREVLGVTSLADRQDVLDQFNRLMENAARKPSVFRAESHGQADQVDADRFGIALVSSAGYDARAYSSFFDRLAGTEGHTGSFFSRLFGTTSPDSRRLADAIRTSARLPAECAVASASDPAAYRAWQVAVTMASVASREEHLPGLQRQVPLTPFRDRIRHVRFSPDGRYVLVKDDATVSVLQRQPFEFQFGIPAKEARSADFTPDSSAVVLHTSDLRVERWSVAGRAMAEVFDLHWPKTCLESAAAPDGRTVACVDVDGDLAIIDATSGLSIFQKKSFFQIGGLEMLLRMIVREGNTRTSGSLSLQFSANGQYFAAGFENFDRNGTLVFDVSKKAVIPLKDQARRLLTGSFTFVDGHRLIGLNAREPDKSGVVSLPDGAVEMMAVPAAVFDRAAAPRFVIMRPWGAHPIALFDVEAKKPHAGFETLALDTFDGHYVTDTGVGEVGLFTLEGRKAVSRLKVDPSPITRVRTAAVSPDFHWLALSGPSRAVVWDLRGQMAAAYMRDFSGSHIGTTGQLYVDIPKAGAEPRAIVRLDLQSRASTQVLRIDPTLPAEQYGPWLLTRQPVGMPWAPTGYRYDMRDVTKPAPLWTKSFENDFPHDFWMHPLSDALAFVWAGDSPGGRTRIARDERLKKTVNRGDLRGDALLEIVDAATGHPRGMVLVETGKGSFHVMGVLVRGDRLIVTDCIGRVLSYSLSTGELDGYAFGSEPIVTADGATVAIETGEGRLAVLDARTMAKRTELRFKHPVVFTAFSPDGTGLFVLTADQTAHALDLRAP